MGRPPRRGVVDPLATNTQEREERGHFPAPENTSFFTIWNAGNSRGRPPQRGVVDPWSRSTGMKNTCPSLGGIGILYYLYASSTRQSDVSAENLTIQGQDGEEREERGLFPGREITSFFTIFSFLIIRTCSQPLRNNMVTANRPGTPHRRDRSTTRRPPRTLLPRGRP